MNYANLVAFSKFIKLNENFNPIHFKTNLQQNSINKINPHQLPSFNYYFLLKSSQKGTSLLKLTRN